MLDFLASDRVRIDIPDLTDPDHEYFHGHEGTVKKILDNGFRPEHGDFGGTPIYRVSLDDGATVIFGGQDLRPGFGDTTQLLPE